MATTSTGPGHQHDEDISMTKIESWPHRNQPIRVADDVNLGTAKHFEYLFYIDFGAGGINASEQFLVCFNEEL
ncbi:hypothetical protein RHMOL_Rhmol10G0118000 [Rhododendron molle]|uniref:Uncharacterized protein n=1 Tax=Rhododendron molle TaxID=49168 RepID=A0ACC0M2A5_RHOML|nr:hypothetical protein RHMOL_Rhmol10G0118000 [Rhododendron molle]